MEKLSGFDVEMRLCKAEGKWGMIITFDPDFGWDEIRKAAPFLDEYDLQIYLDGAGFFLFDSQEECEEHYDMVVGDDGPTRLNDYNGQCRVYALTISSDGQPMNENT